MNDRRVLNDIFDVLWTGEVARFSSATGRPGVSLISVDFGTAWTRGGVLVLLTFPSVIVFEEPNIVITRTIRILPG